MTRGLGRVEQAGATGATGMRLSLMTLVAVIAAAWVVISTFLTWSRSAVIVGAYDNRGVGSPAHAGVSSSGENLWQAAPLVATVLVTSAVLVAVISPRWGLTRPLIWLAAVLAFLLAAINWISPPAYRSGSDPTRLPGTGPGTTGVGAIFSGGPSHPGAGEIVALSAGLALVIFACSLGRPAWSRTSVTSASPTAEAGVG